MHRWHALQRLWCFDACCRGMASLLFDMPAGARHSAFQLAVLCRAKDSADQMASAWRLVQVQQVYSVAMTLPLMLAADDLIDAQAQADLITTGNNASSGLSSALAAGLNAGEPSAPRAFHPYTQSTAATVQQHIHHMTQLDCCLHAIG